ncbi:MAG: Rpn family recombination-promoting nuclease/putative transposase [Thermodesulfobacteriota bacterium]
MIGLGGILASTGTSLWRYAISDITSPHDRFFKEVFSRPEVAEDFLLHVLPVRVSSLIRPGTFRLRKDSFVDTNLREYFSDLLYQVDFKEDGRGFLYILFEHKSHPSSDIAFQLLRYMTRIWEYAAKESGGSLPPVFPVVLYHGTTEWKVSLNFAALYQGPESMRQLLLDFAYCLVDLSTFSDEELKMGAMATAGSLLLKHVHRDDLVARLRDVFRLLGQMNEQTALEFLETTLRYLGAATERVTMDDCRQALQEALTETGERHMDRLIEELFVDYVVRHREKWIQEGIEEGIKKGVKEGIKKGVKEGTASLIVRRLVRKFGCLDSGLEARVRQLPVEELELLLDELPDLPNETAVAEWVGKRNMAH